MHPLKISQKILSVNGECDDNGISPPGSIGVIISQYHYEKQGWTYGIEFPETFVFIDQNDGIDDITKYRLI